MTNRNKIVGDRFERAVVDYARARGFPWAERTRAGYARDHGDVHLDPPSGGVVVQCKNHARLDLPGWLAQLAEQTEAAGADHGVLVAKRRGLGDVGKSYAVLELEQLLLLLRQAGYGAPPDRP